MEHGDHFFSHAHHHGGHHLRHLIQEERPGRVLTVRCHSGLSGDIFLAGLAALNMENLGIPPLSDEGRHWLKGKLADIMPELRKSVLLVRKEVSGIMGWHAKVDLPHEHEHRHLGDIQKIISSSGMQPQAREMALSAFELIARCEGATHGLPAEEVHFHEVGALDSILDICLDCELFALLNPDLFICAPLPVADGQIHCAHGLLPAPAPAALRMLTGIPVRPFPGNIASGELVTPTAVALLRAFGAKFGSWPAFTIRHSALAYGTKYFPDAPNGAIFALGESWSGQREADAPDHPRGECHAKSH